VVLPQAVRVMMPSFINQWVSLIKDTQPADDLPRTDIRISRDRVSGFVLRAAMDCVSRVVACTAGSRRGFRRGKATFAASAAS
jgi:ABC-type amino acid transport system permease subunit